MPTCILSSAESLNPVCVDCHHSLRSQVDAQQSVDNIQKVKVYRYDYKPEYADVAGIDEESRREVGVIAQEVQEIMPDAVKEVVG